MATYRKQKLIDSCYQKEKKTDYLDWLEAKYILQENQGKTVLFTKQGRTDNFITNNLHIHFIKSDKKAIFDSVDGFLKFQERTSIKYAFQNRKCFIEFIQGKYGSSKKYFRQVFQNFFSDMSFTKVWNISIVGSLVFGMFLMTFIYRYLDQGVSAVTADKINSPVIAKEMSAKSEGKVLGVENTAQSKKAKAEEKKITRRKQFQKGIEKIVKGYPIEKMAPYIVQQDKDVAAFLIGIAKQESSWGKHVPVYKGQDCYNYWGFRRKRKKMGSGGHTCFDSPQDAVETVASRIKYLINKKKINTSQKMVVVWKCGYDCSHDNPQAVKRWINTVNIYSKKVKKIGQ